MMSKRQSYDLKTNVSSNGNIDAAASSQNTIHNGQVNQGFGDCGVPEDSAVTNGYAPAQDTQQSQDGINNDQLSPETTEDLRCGYGSCKPECLQKGNNSKALLAAIVWFVFVQSFLVNGINNVNTTTLERRFDLKSAEVAWVSSSYDITAGILCIVLGYVATFSNKGRLLTLMAAVMTTGAFVLVTPHLFAGEYKLGRRVTEVCDGYGNQTNHTASCARDRSSDSNYLYVLVSGMGLVGFGGAGAYILGIPWLDDNISTRQTPLYVGTVHAFAAIGPAVGFLAGGALLNTFVDVGKTTSTLSPSDPRWVGAWWIGYLIAACLGIMVVLFLACFPPTLPGAEEIKKQRVSQSYKGAGDIRTSDVSFGRSLSDIGYSLKILICNPPWIFITIAGTIESGMVGAFATFMPKVLQFQFGMSSATSAIIVGALVVPGAAIGQIMGGVIPNRIHSKVRGLLLQCGVCSTIALACSFAFLLRCDMPKMAGISVEYFNSSIATESPSPLHPCNTHCGCTSESYAPVCGTTDNVEYFSPCHAGCSREEDGVYSDCSCIPAPDVNDVSTSSGNWGAREGICDVDCGRLKYFLPAFFLLVLATFTTNTGGHTATIRLVPDKTRSFSYGLQFAIVRFCGNTPGHVVFGMIFDSSCLVWQEECGSRGSCWIYDNAALAQRLCLICLVVKATSSVLFFLAAGVYRPPKSRDENDHVVVETPEMKQDLGLDVADVSVIDTGNVVSAL